MKLTEENIKYFGFERLPRVNNCIAPYINRAFNFIINYCNESNENFMRGYWYYGSDFIYINTVEELKMLYKLVTKKEL